MSHPENIGRYEFLHCTMLVSAWTWQSKSEAFYTLRSRQIVIVDEKGTERIFSGSPVPDHDACQAPEQTKPYNRALP